MGEVVDIRRKEEERPGYFETKDEGCSKKGKLSR